MGVPVQTRVHALQVPELVEHRVEVEVDPDRGLFEDALVAEPGSPARQRFIFADGRGPDGSLPPNNWLTPVFMSMVARRPSRRLGPCSMTTLPVSSAFCVAA